MNRRVALVLLACLVILALAISRPKETRPTLPNCPIAATVIDKHPIYIIQDKRNYTQLTLQDGHIIWEEILRDKQDTSVGKTICLRYLPE